MEGCSNQPLDFEDSASLSEYHRNQENLLLAGGRYTQLGRQNILNSVSPEALSAVLLDTHHQSNLVLWMTTTQISQRDI